MNAIDETRSRQAKAFYEKVDRDATYTPNEDPIQHPFYDLLTAFIGKWNLRHKKCLEIGSATGLFQDLVRDYTGVDVASGLSPGLYKLFVAPDHSARVSFYSMRNCEAGRRLHV